MRISEGKVTKLAQDFSVPNWLSIRPFGDRPGWGEDEPVWFSRLEREGWKLTAYPAKTKDDFGAKVWIEFDPPIRWEKVHPLRPKEFTLQMSIFGMNERNGPWYLVEHTIIGKNGYVGAVGRSDWLIGHRMVTCSSPNPAVCFDSGTEHRVFGPVETSDRIADFSALTFEGKSAPNEAREWPSRKAKSRTS